jgi:hypothetical protein
MNNPKIEKAIKMSRAYHAMPGNGAGGSLHIVLDDGNLETCHVQFCLEWAEDRNDKPGVALAEFLLTLTEDERCEVYNSLYPYA